MSQYMVGGEAGGESEDSGRPALYGMSLGQLREAAAGLGLPRYAAGQMASWLYRRGCTDIAAMTDLSKAAREALASSYRLGLEAPRSVAVSRDGTKKYLYRTADGHYVESAYIPDGDRATLCVSSQAGCRMGCRFCATGRQGLQHSLTAAEILNQIVSLPERDRLTNLVFMGMGEPLDNTDNVLRALEILTSEWGFGWSPTRITVSTAGVVPQLERFLRETKVHLAVSLHNPFHEERMEIMPVERAWPIAEVASILRRHDFTHQRRVSFEYIVMEGRQRLAAPHTRTHEAAQRDQVPHQPDPLPPHPRLTLLLARRRTDDTLPRRTHGPRHPDHDPDIARRGHPGGMRAAEHPNARGGGRSISGPARKFAPRTATNGTFL